MFWKKRGIAIANVLGNHKAVNLGNHGFLTVCQTVDSVAFVVYQNGTILTITTISANRGKAISTDEKHAEV